MVRTAVLLCPGQGAQAVGMGEAWCEASPAAARVFAEAEAELGSIEGRGLRALCFDGPADLLNRTDVSQPAIYTCSVACHMGLVERGLEVDVRAAAGLSLGEFTALHLAGVFDFLDGLRLVAERGRLMQAAAEAAKGGMVALIGAEDEQADEVCRRAAGDGVLVAANYNAPGQIVLSGDLEACGRATAVAEEMGLRATKLAVAGAFHSPLMQPAADRMADALDAVPLKSPNIEVWSNVTGERYGADVELLKTRLVEQIISPVKWSQTCGHLPHGDDIDYHELAPGSVLRGLMRRIDRNRKVTSHDEPPDAGHAK